MSNKSNSRQHGLVGNKRPVSGKRARANKLLASKRRSERRQVTAKN